MQKKFLLVVMAILPLLMNAQFTLTGKITNKKSGSSLPGALVQIKNTTLSAVSDENGYFIIENIDKGKSIVAVSFLGFKTYTEEIMMSSNTSLNIKMTATTFFSDEVIISAIRATDESPTTYTNMDQGQIEKKNTGKDLPYILKTTPSAVVTSDGGAGVGYTGLRIRGTDLTGINVTLNGIPVNDGESQAVFFVDLPDLASSVNDMQIQRGVGTSTNGAASFGASINISTGDDRAEPYAEISSAAGSFNTFKNTVMFGTGLMKNKWNFSGRLSKVTSDGYVDRASSDLKSAYLSGGYYGEKDIFKAVILTGDEKTYQSWYGIPKDSLETNRTYNPAGEIYDNDGKFVGYYDNQTDNYTQNYYQLHYAHQFNNTFNITSSAFLTTGNGYYESYKNDEDLADYGINDTIIGGDTITSTNLIRQKWLDNKYYGVNLSGNYTTDKLALNIGGGYNCYDGDHYGMVVWSQVAQLGLYDQKWYDNTGKKTNFNVFAKANYKVNSKLNVYADLQYRVINYKINGTHDDLGTLDQEHDYNFFNPKAGIFYKINDKQNLYLSAGIANREPNRSVFRDADSTQNIKAECLTDIELGYSYNNPVISLDANLFYMNYKDQLVLTGQINNVGAAIKTNVDKSYRAGIEIVGGVRFTDYLEWNFNATYSQNKIKDFVSYVDDWDTWGQRVDSIGNTDISFSPDIIASSDISVMPIKNLKLSLVTKYVGKQYIDNTSSDEKSIDAYLVNNINLYYTIHPGFVKQIDFMLNLNNVFNEQYETNAWVYSYYYGDTEYNMNGYFPQAEFNFMFGINLKF